MHHPRYIHTTGSTKYKREEESNTITVNYDSELYTHIARVLYKYRTKRIHTYILEEDKTTRKKNKKRDRVEEDGGKIK